MTLTAKGKDPEDGKTETRQRIKHYRNVDPGAMLMFDPVLG